MNETKYIPPDYDDENDLDENILEEDEGKIETTLDKQQMDNGGGINQPSTPPFSQPRWGQQTQQTTPTYPWQSRPSSPQTNIWGQSQQSSTPWRPSSSGWGSGSNYSQQAKTPLNRNKKVVFIDFLDCIAETFNSNQVPGYLPRDIYDLTPKFNVWQKLSALNPEKVYILIPRNLLPTTNGAQGWEATLTYYCCSLSSFLRIPYTGCQVLVQSVIGQPKEEIMLSVIDDPEKPITRNDILSIGIYSGYNGQSNIDKIAAERCGIDYVDLYELLNNMS